MRPLILPPQSAEERWRQIPNHPTYYASDRGRIWSARAGRVLRPDYASSRYGRIDLDSRRTVPIHHLVAQTWLGPRPEGMLVLHRNDDPRGNNIENLYYGTLSDNQYDAVANGRHHEAKKTECPRGHSYDDANTYLLHGKRYCRACRRVAAKAAPE